LKRVGVRELAHAEIIDDQERHGRQLRDVVLARAGNSWRGSTKVSIVEKFIC
jgi:hypothetical protein